MTRIFTLLFLLSLTFSCEEPHFISDWNQEAAKHIKTKDYNLAIAAAYKSLEENKGNTHDYYSHYLIAFARRNQNQYLKAIDHYLKANQLIPEESNFDFARYWILNNIGKICELHGHYKSAITYYEQAASIASEKDKAGILLNLGIANKATGNLDEAIDVYLEALEMASQFNDQKRELALLNQLGLAYKEAKDYEKARVYFENVISYKDLVSDKTRKYIGRAYHNIGNTYRIENRFDEAIPYYELAIQWKEKPQYEFISYKDLGQIYYERGDFQQAQQYIEKAVAQYAAVDRTKDNYEVFRMQELVYRKLQDDAQQALASDQFYEESIAFVSTKETIIQKLSAAQIDQKINNFNQVSSLLQLNGQYEITIALVAGLFLLAGLSILAYRRWEKVQIYKNVKEITDQLNSLAQKPGEAD